MEMAVKEREALELCGIRHPGLLHRRSLLHVGSDVLATHYNNHSGIGNRIVFLSVSRYSAQSYIVEEQHGFI